MPYEKGERQRSCEPMQLSTFTHQLGEGYPKRDCLITRDEIMDLKILLNTTSSVTSFLEAL